MRGRIVATAALAAVLSGCGSAPEPGVWPLTPDQAYARLAGSELPELVSARQCGILIHVRPEGVPNERVTWRVFSSGSEMVHFTARLAPAEGGTRVAVDIEQSLDGREAYDGTRVYPRPAFRQPLRPAVEEQVAALLEGRGFDPGRLPPAEADTVCNVQRAGLEHGTRFRRDDNVGMTAQQTAAARRNWGNSGGWGAGTGR